MLDSIVRLATDQVHAASVLTSSGIVRPYGPVTLARLGKTLRDWGLGFAGGFGSLAVRSPDGVGLVDELGELTWGELDDRSTRLANALAGLGVGSGDAVALLARNHRGFVDASVALSKLGADILYLNTAFSGPQLGEVCAREGAVAVIYDEEFEGLLERSEVQITRVVAWHEGGDCERPVLEQLIEKGDATTRRPPERKTRPVILTSGTTGTPKGAPRGEAGVDAAVSLLSRLPLRTGWRCHIAAPLFHTWGWAHLNLAMLLGSTLVLTRTFNPAQCLVTLQEKQCDSLVVIPVMLQRILNLDADQHEGDWSRLKVVAASGSALPGDLGTTWMDTFGDNLYNTYGSTEVAWATIATPADLRAAPGTAGKPPRNTVVTIYDEDGEPVEGGATGRIFVGNSMLFEGYTGDGDETKDSIDGLMSAGDVGHFDKDGYLFVEGRDDEMIVSGGENVFPKEVEDCLSRHDRVEEAACLGVHDEDFGTRLRAFVVTSGGRGDDELTETLKAHVKDRLARYKVPRDVVYLDELPRNATGKILKRELADNDTVDTHDNDDEPEEKEDQ